jgi:hypothetical protein
LERKTRSLVVEHPTNLRESAIMRKAIILIVATAWLAAPAIAGTNDTTDMTARPNVQSRTTAAAQDAQRSARANKRDDIKKGLGRNPEDCNKGCIGGNPR